MPFNFLKKHKALKWLLVGVAIFFIFILFLGATYLYLEKKYENKIYPNVYLGRINLSGLSDIQAYELLNKKVSAFNQEGIIFSYKEKKSPVVPMVASLDGVFVYSIINFDLENDIKKTIDIGRKKNFWKNNREKLEALRQRKTLPFTFTVNEKEMKDMLIAEFSPLETPSKNAELIYATGTAPDIFSFSVLEEEVGKNIDYEEAIEVLKNRLEFFDESEIRLIDQVKHPDILAEDCINIDEKANLLLSLMPLTLKFENQEWPIEKNILVGWLALKVNTGTSSDDKIIVGLNKEKIFAYLKENLAEEIDKEPINAKFEIKDGRVMEFQASKDGWVLDYEENFNKIQFELLSGRTEIELETKEIKSEIITADVNNLNIREIVGTGESNFAGSPNNRRHNIKIGSESLKGIIIEPGQEFSLNKGLGEINAATGYLPELVIKNNQTIPEYGGGLCQVATTLYRAALATGLPITMRRNHSYRVSYYEPAGTDATIYNPWPDFKFINDMPTNILIQYRIEGDNHYFDFWGTKDHRVVEITEPTIYNITRPGPTKIIETTELKKGEKKCTEKARNGADAYFDYKVIYADSEIKEERVRSHYVPWREVCLVGVEPEKEEDLDQEKNEENGAENTKEEE